MYRFMFDHAVSDGEGGYGAVCVVTPIGEVHWVGRNFARTVLVERWPDSGLTYDMARSLVTFLSGAPSSERVVEWGHDLMLVR